MCGLDGMQWSYFTGKLFYRKIWARFITRFRFEKDKHLTFIDSGLQELFVRFFWGLNSHFTGCYDSFLHYIYYIKILHTVIL